MSDLSNTWMPFTAGAIGLLGVGIGAWLNSISATTRERWNLKRELYTRLLENLDELIFVLNEQLHWSYRGDDEVVKNREKELGIKDVNIRKQLRKAVSVAAIMLPDQSLAALKAMQKGWEGSRQAESYDEHLEIQITATEKAYNSLIESARNDLKIKQG